MKRIPISNPGTSDPVGVPLLCDGLVSDDPFIELPKLADLQLVFSGVQEAIGYLDTGRTKEARELLASVMAAGTIMLGQ